MNELIYEPQTEEEDFYCSTTFSKSNYLIQARYNYTLLCNQLLAIALYKSKKEGDSWVARFSVSEVKQMLNKNYKDFYSQIKASAQKMNNTQIFIENAKTGVFEFYQLIPTFQYDNGECQVYFNPQLNHLIGDLTTNFSTFDVKTLATLESVNAFRLYESIKSKSFYHKNYTGERNGRYIVKFSVAELKVLFNAIDINRKEIAEKLHKTKNPDYEKVLDIAEELYEKEKDLDIPTKDKYPMPKWRDWRDFQKRCIVPSLEQINDKTELSIEYTTERSKKSVKYITFYVTDESFDANKKKQLEQTQEDDIDSLMDEVNSIIEEKIAIKDIKLLLKTADNDIEKIKKAYEIAKGQNVENLVAFLISAIKKDYNEPVKSKKKAKNDLKLTNQREYNFEELEERLLNK